MPKNWTNEDPDNGSGGGGATPTLTEVLAAGNLGPQVYNHGPTLYDTQTFGNRTYTASELIDNGTIIVNSLITTSTRTTPSFADLDAAIPGGFKQGDRFIWTLINNSTVDAGIIINNGANHFQTPYEFDETFNFRPPFSTTLIFAGEFRYFETVSSGTACYTIAKPIDWAQTAPYYRETKVGVDTTITGTSTIAESTVNAGRILRFTGLTAISTLTFPTFAAQAAGTAGNCRAGTVWERIWINDTIYDITLAGNTNTIMCLDTPTIPAGEAKRFKIVSDGTNLYIV